jgi:hypothetical protein
VPDGASVRNGWTVISTIHPIHVLWQLSICGTDHPIHLLVAYAINLIIVSSAIISLRHHTHHYSIMPFNHVS